IVGEYIASIHTQVLKRPHVIERERINFTAAPSAPSTGVEAFPHGVPSTATSPSPGHTVAPLPSPS
ncbi:MAG TPA: hypothetical protein VFH51_07635, partial [Myxococcota bacterium]|nr:hypothetical protein [Myxococcota bacterium]